MAAPTSPLVLPSSPRTGALMATGSMLCVQIGLAVSVGLFDRIGSTGTAALRLLWAGLLLAVIARPRPSAFTRSGFAAAVALGTVTAGLTILFTEALARIPLGTAAALEFLGPLGVALLRGRGRARGWALLAALGVVLLTNPWQSGLDPAGVAFALAAAGLLGRLHPADPARGRPGHRPDGARGVDAGGRARRHRRRRSEPASVRLETGALDVSVLLAGLGIALLLPVVPFSLELLALRRLTTAAFGTLMCLEPAIALGVGVLFLSQTPSPAAAAGVAAVVLAGIGAERAGARRAQFSTSAS